MENQSIMEMVYGCNDERVLAFAKKLNSKIARLRKEIDEGNRLEEEPPLFTRDEVIDHMHKATTLYGLTGKVPRKSELYSLLSK